MSKPKVWTLPALLDRIWMLSKGRRTAVEVIDEKRIAISLIAAKCVKRVVTGWDEDYKPRTYELNKISAASAAALYERSKTMRKEAAARVQRLQADLAAQAERINSANARADEIERSFAAMYQAVPLANRNAWREQLGLPPEEA